jgi:hypothetical protein
LGETKEKKLTWANVDLENEVELERFEEEALERAGTRIKKAVEVLEKLGIVDKKGRRIHKELPPDMQPGSKTDV